MKKILETPLPHYVDRCRPSKVDELGSGVESGDLQYGRTGRISDYFYHSWREAEADGPGWFRASPPGKKKTSL